MFEDITAHPAELTGWGLTAPSRATLADPTPEALAGLLARVAAERAGRGLIARGLGRSYGDAAQNAGGTVLGPLPGRIELDRSTARVRVSGGSNLHDVMQALIPTGYFVPVTPGTRYVTIGGAVAADVHGKNHHRVGSMGDHVESLDLFVADGTVRTVGPDNEPDLFWATVGGMGLTGVITSAVLRVPEVGSGWMRVRTERLDDLATVMARMRQADAEATYSVAWIDTLARGRRLGRSVLTLGEHADAEEVTARDRAERWAVPGHPLASVPAHVPPHLMSWPAIKAFNEFWFRKAPRLREDELQSISSFFHPLDAVGGWNRLYGRLGFVQYQFVLPDQAEDDLPMLLQKIADAGHPSFLSVLKRFGPANPGVLSFPMGGWTVALDVPTDPGLRTLFAELDAMLVERGGRIYLAKDSRMSASTAALMYPNLDRFREIRATVDPDGLFQSDLSRRLRI